jgi:subtilisin family serine protease
MLKFLPIFLLLLVACNPTTEKTEANTSGGSDEASNTTGGSGAGSTTPGWSFPASSSSVQYAFQGLEYSYTALTNITGGGWTLSGSTPPNGLAVSQVGTTVVLAGTPTGSGITTHGFEIIATKGADVRTARFTLIVRGDLLRPFQWHLEQTATTDYFSDDPGVTADDQDMNVTSVWKDYQEYGAGVRVAVSDSGVEVSHPDLSVNMLSGMHRNYKTGSSGAGWTGTPTTYGEAHGTAVAGIIAAVGWNDIGGTGVAPQVRLAGFQLIDSAQTSDIMLHQTTGDFEIFNYSYGTGLNADVADDDLYIAQLRDRVTNGRSGKGQIYVKAGGNEYFGFCETDDDAGFVCPPQNANIPAENNSPFMIVVGATAATPIAASYSNAGSNLWVSAPGGEDGDDEPAIISTDLATCSQGYSTNTGLWDHNRFETASADTIFTTYNSNCNYTSMMNGTSSAAPNVAGVVALLLGARPELTWRDVKHILATSSHKVPAGASTNHPYVNLRLAGYTYEQGWVTNAAGFSHHNWYGFGRVDALQAMIDANSHTLLPAWFESNEDFDIAAQGRSGLSLTIPDADANGVTSSRVMGPSVFDADTIIESVQLKIKVSHARSGTVGVELTSPSGTKSILLNINNALFVTTEGGTNPDADLDVVLTTHAFYGERAIAGANTWTVRVIDGFDDDVTGTLTDWSINVLGHLDP